MYTPSLYGCLASHLISKSIQELKNTRLCLFSYGSGLASSMFSVVISENVDQRFTLEQIHKNLNQQKDMHIQNRVEIEPSLYDKYLNKRESIHSLVPHESNLKQSCLYPGAWYLKSIDKNYRRFYERNTNDEKSFKSNEVQSYLIEELSKI